jgi:hypothetical protein
MIDAPEKRLIEALKSVDAHGDVAPAHVHDPMSMLLRESAVQTHLMRWDDGRGRYVLTGTGRRRISAGNRTPGAVVSFFRAG